MNLGYLNLGNVRAMFVLTTQLRGIFRDGVTLAAHNICKTTELFFNKIDTNNYCTSYTTC